MKDRIIINLDNLNKNEALNLARKLQGRVWGFKINHLFFKSPDIVWPLADYGKLFLDFKFHDIPSTVANYVRDIKELSPDIFTVHASGGKRMMKVAVEGKGNDCQVFAVTILSSFTEEDCQRIYGMPIKDKVIQLALESKESEVDGIVCGGLDLPFLNEIPDLKTFRKIVQGVRPFWAPKDDQERIVTPVEALRLGAYKIGIGRAVTKPPPNIGDSLEAFNRIMEEAKMKLRL